MVFKWKLPKAAGLSWLIAACFWFQIPAVTLESLFIASLRGLLVSVDVALILFGSVSLLGLLELSGDADAIRNEVGKVSGQYSLVTALLLVWFFCAFLEGAAGFGAPAAIIAPLLVTLGFSPMLASLLPLLGDSASVPFGAVGTPVRVGFEGLANEGVAVVATGINLVAAAVVPFFIYFAFRKDAPPGTHGRTFSDIRLTGLAFVCFSVPAFCVSFFGPEFPSLIGSLVGILLFLWFAKERLQPNVPRGPLVVAFFPYLALAAILIAGKAFFGNEKIVISTEPAIAVNQFQPGIAFAIVFLLIYFKNLSRKKTLNWRVPIATALRRLPDVTLAVFFMAAMAQFSMMFFKPEESLSLFESQGLFRFAFLFAIPFIGAFGAFIAGSATVSNLLFASVLLKVGEHLGIAPVLVLSLQLLGAGAGNMISLQNIAAVQATVGIHGCEHTLIRKLILPCLCYASLIGIAGVILSNFL